MRYRYANNVMNTDLRKLALIQTGYPKCYLSKFELDGYA